jgi:hypothetical protein
VKLEKRTARDQISAHDTHFLVCQMFSNSEI